MATQSEFTTPLAVESRKQGFRRVAIARPNELFRQRPGPNEPYVEFVDSDGFACFVGAAAIKTMAKHGREADGREVIGHLGGRMCHDGKGPYVLVERPSLTRQARGTAGSVYSDAQAQLDASQQFDRHCRPLDRIGWWHTHDDTIGLFYSSEDRANQASWTDVNSIGIVLHPHLSKQALKVFRGPEARELTLKRGDDWLRILKGEPSYPVPAPAIRQNSPQPLVQYVTSPRSTADQRATVAICISIAAILLALLTHILVWTGGQRLSTSNIPTNAIRSTSRTVKPPIVPADRAQGDSVPSSLPADLDSDCGAADEATSIEKVEIP